MGRLSKGLALVLVLSMVLGTGTAFAKKGNAGIITEDRDVKNYSQLVIGIAGVVTLEQCGEEGVTIEADEEIMPYIETEVRGRRLLITHRERGWYRDIGNRYNIRVHVKCKSLEVVTISGSADLTCKSLEGKELELGISGSGDAKFEKVKTDNLEMGISGSGSITIYEYAGTRVRTSVSGSGDLELSGKAKSMNVGVSGSGTVDARNLETEEVNVRISGSGNLYTWANELISGSVSGSGSVFYSGRPAIDLSSSGSGSIRHRGR